ncbi:hypothetical protein [Halocatena pleomorpha]|uniref:DUF2178 domain-containing protein n=1 Tax=Halocatena pleomorpha TaxID=1785090 RepID=A0A3P3R3Q6_9EURY|nr:hypothetical protein [Halocatena pleomorpha]RRJ28102.1 hypothetical protein EIK79_16635 [Halocatena pleomorpha]
MSGNKSSISNQKRNGYIMLVGVVVVLIGSVLTIQYYNLPTLSYLGALIPASILLLFGYRTTSASLDGKALGDERTSELYSKAGLNAFWLLITIIIIDDMARILPRDISRSIYIISAVIIYALYMGYYRMMS